MTRPMMGFGLQKSGRDPSTGVRISPGLPTAWTASHVADGGITRRFCRKPTSSILKQSQVLDWDSCTYGLQDLDLQLLRAQWLLSERVRDTYRRLSRFNDRD